MKQRIVLKESDFHRVIKESVRQVLSEVADRLDPNDWTYNEFGEPTVWQYKDVPDPNRWMVGMADEILSGEYDDEIWDDDWYNELDDDDGWDNTLKDAVIERRKILDSNYAMKHGYERSPNFYDYRDVDNPIRAWDKLEGIGMDMKRLKRETKGKNNEDDNANATKRYLRKKYGGIPRDKWDKLSQKRECKFRYNKRNPYTQKLHTKGSLNRELIAMDKAKKH